MTTPLKVDVAALLKLADDWVNGRNRQNDGMAILRDVAVALRAEQERANQLDAEAMTARSLLGIVLDRCWPPGTTGPSIARRARAFLADEGQVTQHDDLSGPTEARYAIRFERKRANDAEEENARLRAQLATADEAHAHTQARLAEVEKALAACDKRRIEVELNIDENVEARNSAMFRAADLRVRLTETERALASFKDLAELRRVDLVAATKAEAEAIAAQAKAESEAASLRVEVTDLRRKVSEGETLVESLIAWAKKGRA